MAAGEDATADGTGSAAESEEATVASKTGVGPTATDTVTSSGTPAIGAPQPEPAAKAANGGASLELVMQEGAGGREREAASRATSSGASWCSVGQLAWDWASEVMSRLSPISGDQSALVPSGAAPLVSATTQWLFNDYRSHLAACSKEALAKLYQVEKSVLGVNDRQTALFQKTLGAYKKGKGQY